MVFDKLYEIIQFQQQRFAGKKVFNQKILGRWESRSTNQFIHQVDELSAGLVDLPISDNKHIGILASHGSTDWFVIDVACLQIGLVTIPINVNYSDDELQFILSETKLNYCFVNEDKLAERLTNLGFPKDKIISYGNSIRHTSWTDVRKHITNKTREKLQHTHQAIKDTDLATIIYTSGSTGLPKGVMLSHRNIVSNIKSTISLIPVSCRHRVVSFLPLSHIFERMVVYTYMAVGADVYFVQEPKEIISVCKEIRPHYISSVPRVIEKLHNEINLNIKKRSKLIQKLLRIALKSGESENRTFLESIKNSIILSLADVFIFHKWRNILGGKIQAIIVGAAAMQPNIARLFTRAGIPIKEGYGLTETSPVISFNRFEPGGTRFGTVGIPIPSVEVKIDEPDVNGFGEVVVRGPNVMLGYYNNPHLTSRKLDKEGWFYTGDIGKFSHKRFLSITDRKKNIFKTSSGQYIYPQKIEDHVRQHDAIDQLMTIGFQKPFIAALIVPDFDYLKEWCKQENIHWTAEIYMIENDRVKAYYSAVIEEMNEGLKSYERIKTFTLLHIPWSVENEEYTPTLKLRRDRILEKYGEKITKMYWK